MSENTDARPRGGVKQTVDCPAGCGAVIERTATGVIGHLELSCTETGDAGKEDP